ncbi:MAG TPA: hypothetical protein VGH11_19400 [Jatrophihabitans sp.]|jgi:predicted lipoprotein with Yx(FWY)xxD motif
MLIKTVSVAAAATLLLAGCSSSSKSTPAAAPKPSINGALGTVSTSLGTILTDNSGKTLYRFAPDSAGKSNCDAACLKYWPAVSAPAAVPSSVAGVNAAIGSLTRSDGTKQLTVAGFPVYTYVGDSAPGMASGQGKNLSGGLWWVLSNAGAPITSAPAPASSSAGGGGGGYGGY